MRAYRFHEITDVDFETLIGQLCLHLLGTGVVLFAAGKDGGRDGRFSGTASSYPSAASPLAGTFIIQAKHTSNPAASCSDSEFGTILKKERPRVEALATAGEIDHYLLFTNRRLTAGTEKKTRTDLERIPKIKSAAIFGIENIKQYLNSQPNIWKNLGFDTIDTPFRFNPQDLADVVRSFHAAADPVAANAFSSASDFRYLDKKSKNKLNALSPAYFQYIQEDSLPLFASIKTFLEDPRNSEFRSMYHETADELKQKVITTRERFESFDEVLTFLAESVIAGNKDVVGRGRLVRAFLHYMYFNCDIGQRDAQANQTP
jgi:hypothetical protein